MPRPEDALGIGLGSDILIVDDDAGNRTAYEAALAPLGRRCVAVSSGVEALAQLLEQNFALVLLDVAMPGMSGLETARRIRERPRSSGLPILFITGETASVERILEAYHVGAFDFLMKPILPELLRAKVRVYLQLQDRTRALLRESALAREEGSARRIAESASRKKDELLAMLGHELRNPLGAMICALELLKTRGPLGRELSIIERQAEQLMHVVGDFLDFSRITSGKIELRREPVRLASVVADVLDSAQPAIEPRGMQVAVLIPDELLLDADRHRILQVLENLLDNALKYTPDRGRIDITARADGGAVRIAMRDNGRGIAAALMPHLFEPFVQGEQPLDRRDGGLGIGLTLVRTLVELHGGTIEARSGGSGTGAELIMRWPRAPSAARDPDPDPATATRPGPGPARARRVLIVDDNADAAEMLAELLRMSGHSVALAYDGATALEVARDLGPEVALLDLGLPVMDGYELAGRLRELDACRHTRLIAVTGYGQPGDRERSKAAGFSDHVVKPVDLATVEALLTRGASSSSR
jgi:signal transduction histidine kinase